MAGSGKEMTFWDHLDDLRRVVFRVLAVVGILGIGAFIAMPWIFDNVIMAPCSGRFLTYSFFDRIAAATGFGELATDAGFSVDIVSIELASQLFIHLSASCWVALIVGFPIILYMLWGFVAPALYEHERRGITKAFFFGNVMFYLGVAAGYFLVFPLALRFLADYRLSDAIRPIVSLDSYMDNFFTLLLMMGAVFELPLLAWLLGKMGILTRGFFSRYRRHAIVALLIVAALITPTGDPFTLFIVFI
ncbi:MAG: twin-arginine translocase subunit TatC, partial [Muribaculaceae bacterium]|nr:twin-arginine translocase subunit TatC [Muribaculaceae bacterium]